MVATYNQRSESSPPKATTTTHQSAAFEAIDSGARSFPHIPEGTERDSASSSRAPLERQQLQQVGDEHMFHQQVGDWGYQSGGKEGGQGSSYSGFRSLASSSGFPKSGNESVCVSMIRLVYLVL